MKKYEICYGLGGGFGGVGEWEDTDATTLADAEQEAYEQACEEYHGYAGSHGIMDYCDIETENPEYSEEDVELEYDQEMESWLVYMAREKPL